MKIEGKEYRTIWFEEKNKVFKRVKMRHKRGWRIPQIWHDRSCINKSTTDAFNKDAAIEAEKNIKNFFTTTFKLQ